MPQTKVVLPASAPPSDTKAASAFSLRSKRLRKTMVMYTVMVAVSTGTIFWLEHASLLSAFRTAMVAAIGKTFAANWVSGFFE